MPLTEEDLVDIEQRAKVAEQRTQRMAIALLKLDVEKLVAEVRRLRAAETATFKAGFERGTAEGMKGT